MLTEEETWKMAQIVFGPRAGLCMFVHELKSKKLVTPNVARSLYKIIEKERIKEGKRTYIWSFVPVHEDRKRLQFATWAATTERRARRASSTSRAAQRCEQREE